ncbi:MAG: hypothetical protein EPN36_11995 [Rhodanobacteraceae bacterium]|nr:MAG: hypothetical protein EPN36_11995 [Rhodanobacteraceae bacterium]
MRNRVVLAVALLAVSLAGRAGVTEPTRTIPFHGGEAVVRTVAAGEEVTVKDSAGQVLAQSTCDSGTGSYDQIVAFLTALKQQVGARDRPAVAALVDYPLRINQLPRKPRLIRSASQLQADYAGVFTPQLGRKIAKLDPHVVFCRDGMAMGGNGVVWASDHGGTLRLVVINP